MRFWVISAMMLMASPTAALEMLDWVEMDTPGICQPERQPHLPACVTLAKSQEEFTRRWDWCETGCCSTRAIDAARAVVRADYIRALNAQTAAEFVPKDHWLWPSEMSPFDTFYGQEDAWDAFGPEIGACKKK